MIYGNARLWRGGEGFEPGALAVEGGRIQGVLPAKSSADVDLEGAWVLPGLIDAHFHLQPLGASLRTVQLGAATSEQEAAARVEAAAVSATTAAWVLGTAWDETRWVGQRLPTRRSIDTVARPVVLTRVDFHAVWVNGAALAAAGIDRSTVEPPGGKIVRDAAGEPTGVLVDAAADLVTRCIPKESVGQLERDVKLAMERCARVGLTCVHDMMMSPEVLAVLMALERRGELTLRVRAYMHGPQEKIGAVLATPPESDLLRVMGVKLFADGALGSRGAALRAPYSDEPSTSGLLLMAEAELGRAAAHVHRAGHQLAIHAIGDRAADLALGAISSAQGATLDRRHRIEHAQTISPETFAMFAKAGIIASMQPSHCTCDMGWAPARLGPERLRGAYAWRSFLNAGVHLALGSDAPIASENPWDGIQAAVTRTSVAGGTITPDEHLTLREALLGYTRDAAFAAHDPALGELAPGHFADFVVVDSDPFAVPQGRLDTVRTLRTVVGGATVWSARDA